MGLMTANRLWYLLLLSFALSSVAYGECQINVKDKRILPSPEPLLLHPLGPLDIHGFVTPASDGTIRLKKDQRILMACVGSTVQAVRQEVVTATCVSGSTFHINGKRHNFKDLRCGKLPQAASRLSGNFCVQSNGCFVEVELGFQVREDFYTLITSCVDISRREVLYANSTVLSTIGGAEFNTLKLSWNTDFFRHDDVLKYSIRGQLRTLAGILLTEELAKEYVDEAAKKYLIRGPLVTKEDFGMEAMGAATYFLVNAAPRWGQINRNNWKIIEDSIRRYAFGRGVDLHVYTGNIGSTYLESANVENVSLSIVAGAGNSSRIPVPDLMWKLVYEPKKKAAVVFLTYNNPYVDMRWRGTLCPNVSDSITWVDLDYNNVEHGISFSCQYSDFRKVVTSSPELEVTSLLAN